MKDNYFLFKKNNTVYDSRDFGIVCGGFPPIVIPTKRLTIEEIPGRNGTLISSDDCYSSYSKTIECAIEFDPNIDLTWLSGRGKLILSNEIDKEYDVILKNNIELEQIATYYQNFLLKFEVQPFKKSIIVHTISEEEKKFAFNSNGNTFSRPIINITGQGILDISINDKTFQIKNLESTITIDSELEIAIEDGKNALPKMNGEFPKLKPGENNVVIIGDMTNIEIKYQDTFL